MFGIKKKVHFTEANDFLYKKLEEIFLTIQELLSTKEAANFQLSEKAVTAILYEFLFFFVYTLDSTEQYKEDEYFDDFLKRFSPFVKPSYKLEASEYHKRFSNIDEVMNFSITHAQNSGGIGAAIITYILNKLSNETLNEITITRDEELERMFGLEAEDVINNEILTYLPMLAGLVFGEMNIMFAKVIDKYFKKHKIKEE